MRRTANDNILYWGGCPTCGGNDGCMTDSARDHWYYCRAHKAKWCVGGNLFSLNGFSPQYFLENDYRLRHYEVVKPLTGPREGPDAKEEFLANRKAAGQLIDPERCDICVEYCNVTD